MTSPAVLPTKGMNVEDLIDRLLTIGQPGQSLTGTVTENEMTVLCNTAREVFMSQPPFVEIDAPVKVQ